MPSACSGEDAYRAMSSSKVPLGSSMRAHSSPGHSPSIRLGRVGQGVDAECVGEALGRVDGDDARPPAPTGRLERHRGRDRGLADAARSAAHHDGALGDDFAQADHGAGGRGIRREIGTVLTAWPRRRAGSTTRRLRPETARSGPRCRAAGARRRRARRPGGRARRARSRR